MKRRNNVIRTTNTYTFNSIIDFLLKENNMNITTALSKVIDILETQREELMNKILAVHTLADTNTKRIEKLEEQVDILLQDKALRTFR